MTKKELKNLYYLKKEIKEQQKRLVELEMLATKCSNDISEIPHGNRILDKVGNYAVEIADLKRLLDLNLKKCFYELNRLQRFIQSVEDPLVKLIMIYRFEKNMSWVQIEIAIGGNNKAESLRKKLYRYLSYK